MRLFQLPSPRPFDCVPSGNSAEADQWRLAMEVARVGIRTGAEQSEGGRPVTAEAGTVQGCMHERTVERYKMTGGRGIGPLH